MTNNKTLIIVYGPTGIGKTALGIELAKHFKSEIINADSRQVYKEMTIGTAVPSKEELQAIKHHLIQTKSIRQRFNASTFEEEVIRILNDLFSEYNIVFMVGGSGLYIDAVCNGIDELPTITNEIRAKFDAIYETEGIEKIQQLVEQTDPEYYKVVDKNNHKRLLKALEVFDMTGQKYSGMLTHSKKKRPFNVLKIGLNADREILYNRINERVLKMVEAGLVEEARNLVPYRDLTPLKTVGYKELFQAFDGEITEQEAIIQIQNHSRAYARRQITWMRRDKDYHWFDSSELKGIIEKIESFTN